MKCIGIKEQDLRDAEKYSRKVIENAKKQGWKSVEQFDIEKDHEAGYLSELVFRRYLDMMNIEYTEGDKYKPDEGIDFMIDGFNFDVKGTRRNVPPRKNYECSIPAKQRTKNTDYYVFVSLHLEEMVGYICGFISISNFDEASELKSKGQRMGSGKKFKWNTRLCKVEDLTNPKEITLFK